MDNNNPSTYLIYLIAICRSTEEHPATIKPLACNDIAIRLTCLIHGRLNINPQRFHETGALPVNENLRIPSQMPGTYHLPQIHILLIYSANQMISNQSQTSDLVFQYTFISG